MSLILSQPNKQNQIHVFGVLGFWGVGVLAAKNLRIWKFQDGILLQEFANIATFVDDQNDLQEEYIR